MSRRVLFAGLAVAAGLVAVENWLFLRGRSPSQRADIHERTAHRVEGPDAEREAALSRAADSVEPPAALTRTQVEAVLVSIHGEPSPFLLGREREQGVMRRALGLPRLSGTFVGNGRRVAWIEGKPRMAGETFGEFTVSRVERGSVVVVRDGTRYTLALERDDADEVTP